MTSATTGAGSTDDTVEGGLDDPTELEPGQGTLRLADDEDRHTRAEWEEAAAGVLRKAGRLGEDDPDEAVWAKLARTTLDGISVTPLGTPELVEGLVTFGRPTRQGPWDVRTHLGAGGPGLSEKDRNAEVLAELEGGATSVWLEVTGDADLPTLLDGVMLEMAAVVLATDAAAPDADPDPAAAEAAARAFLDHAGDGDLATGTNLGLPAATATAEQAGLARDAGVLGFVVDGTRVHDRGASDGQELGWVLAELVAFLRRLEADDVAVADAVALVEVRLAATDEQLATIAKLRAARRLWARVLEACDVEPVPMRLHAVTSRPMMSRYDPHVNLLRTTVAAFAAGVGGADAVTVLPYDSPLGRPDAFGRRIARNTSHLLVSESHVARVADPAGGAFAVEKLTDDLAAAAWGVLGELDGGADLEEMVAATVEERARLVATRKRPITGLTEYPTLEETRLERDPDPSWERVRRWGGDFEALRDDAPDTHVFLATLGPVAQHTARAGFATNLLAAGGIAVDVAGATEGTDDLLEAYDGQPVACLAGTDTAYGEWGELAAAALRDAGASHVVVAGKPADWADDSCAMGVDALAFLTRTKEALA